MPLEPHRCPADTADIAESYAMGVLLFQVRAGAIRLHLAAGAERPGSGPVVPGEIERHRAGAARHSHAGDGWGRSTEEALKRIRGIRADITALVCSGFGDVDVEGRFAGMNIAGFLQKPHTLKQLAGKVKELLVGGIFRAGGAIVGAPNVRQIPGDAAAAAETARIEAL